MGAALLSDGAPGARIDAALAQAIEGKLIAGGVVAVGTSAGILWERRCGRTWAGPGATPLRPDAIFDVASLTKVVATAPSIMKLVEDRLLTISDPLGRWFPELRGSAAGTVDLSACLTHTSGFRDLPELGDDPWGTLFAGLRQQSAKGLRSGAFRYADVNFILLGEVVRRASGEALEEYARRRFFAPLGMADTSFRPLPMGGERLVPTAGDAGRRWEGEVQDPQARSLGGTAGHAGLFSTAGDLARFCRAVLRGGELEGTRVLSEATIRLMTSPRNCGEGIKRALGWDVNSPYSSARGEFFGDASFGHTGYPGVSVWIDPARDAFVVFLSSRLEYRRTREFNRLRAEISNAAAALTPLLEGGAYGVGG